MTTHKVTKNWTDPKDGAMYAERCSVCYRKNKVKALGGKCETPAVFSSDSPKPTKTKTKTKKSKVTKDRARLIPAGQHVALHRRFSNDPARLQQAYLDQYKNRRAELKARLESGSEATITVTESELEGILERMLDDRTQPAKKRMVEIGADGEIVNPTGGG